MSRTLAPTPNSPTTAACTLIGSTRCSPHWPISTSSTTPSARRLQPCSPWLLPTPSLRRRRSSLRSITTPGPRTSRSTPTADTRAAGPHTSARSLRTLPGSDSVDERRQRCPSEAEAACLAPYPARIVGSDDSAEHTTEQTAERAQPHHGQERHGDERRHDATHSACHHAGDQPLPHPRSPQFSKVLDPRLRSGRYQASGYRRDERSGWQYENHYAVGRRGDKSVPDKTGGDADGGASNEARTCQRRPSGSDSEDPGYIGDSDRLERQHGKCRDCAASSKCPKPRGVDVRPPPCNDERCNQDRNQQCQP